MKHLGIAPGWVEISGKVKFPNEVVERYNDILQKRVSSYEIDFARMLREKKFALKNIVVQPRGLRNSGLMCFANSSIQLLFASPWFTRFCYFMQQNVPFFSSKMTKLSPTWKAVANFLKEFKLSEATSTSGDFTSLSSMSLTERAPPTSTRCLDHTFGIFSSSRSPKYQEDASQFLETWMDLLNEELIQLMSLAPIQEEDHSGWKSQSKGRKLEVAQTQIKTSPLSEIFSTTCIANTFYKNHAESMAYESFFVLGLSIDNANNLETAIAQFLEHQIVEDSPDHSKSNSFLVLPHSLIIRLNRVSFLRGEPRKNPKIVTYPETLDLQNNLKQSFHYRLSAVIQHLGPSPTSGHYICYARRFDGVWMKFNDDMVTKVETDFPLNLEAYMLLYNQIGV